MFQAANQKLHSINATKTKLLLKRMEIFMSPDEEIVLSISHNDVRPLLEATIPICNLSTNVIFRSNHLEVLCEKTVLQTSQNSIYEKTCDGEPSLKL